MNYVHALNLINLIVFVFSLYTSYIPHHTAGLLSLNKFNDGSSHALLIDLAITVNCF